MKALFKDQVFFIILFLFISSLSASEKDQLIVISDPQSDIKLMKIEVLSDEIIRVVASPQESFSNRPSLMMNFEPSVEAEYTVKEVGDWREISTRKLLLKVNLKTGEVRFLDNNGSVLLQEKSGGGKIITPAVVQYEHTQHIQYFFQSPADEAFYGLGAHQNGVFNYKGHDVDLWQYNIVNAIPFLVSSKNYGILWDNNSRTKFGDIREYHSISGLKLFDKNGLPGGLSAEYFKDDNLSDLYLERIENRIEHEFLDVNDPWPNGFAENVRAVRWSGEIASDQEGIHKLRLYCSGFTKVWLDDSLVVDSWRQNWLPWTHNLRVPMKKGRRHKIKIEWIHIGGYIGLKYLTPQDDIYNEFMSLYSEVADQIDYYFIYGQNMDEVISGYRKLTGQAPMMPKWAMGLWQCRERYQTQQQLLDVVREFREREIPLDNIVQDWFYWPEDKWGDHDFDKSRYPDPAAMVRELHQDLNTHIMISVWPKFYVGTKNYQAFNSKGWLYPRNVEKLEKDWVGPGYVSTFYDPYSVEAGKLFWQQINEKLFSLGFDAWWLDATEPDPHSNLSMDEYLLRIGPTAVGSSSRYRNTFSLMNSKSVYEGQRTTAPNQRVFILTRSAFAGQQRYAAATWSGDVATRWYDLATQIPAGLNFSLSGIPYWTTDIGGFAVEPRFERPRNDQDIEEWRELNTRWFQFGTFCPLFRVHGQFPYREMFNIAPDDHPAYKTMLAYDKLRYRLMPYIYSLSGMVTHDDYTIMRALPMDFNNDSRVHSISNQFMFGPALMVNPVTSYKTYQRKVYLPEGQDWYALRPGDYYKGGQEIVAEAPYEEIPLFVRSGSIIPTGPALQYTAEKAADPLRLFVYTGSDGLFKLYEDEGDNYNYEKGEYSIIPFSYDESEHTLTIEDRSGSFDGMLNSRTIEVVWITPQNAVGLDFGLKADKKVMYEGKRIQIKM